jgi:hypothetical protein
VRRWADGVHVDSPGWRNTLRLLVLIGMGADGHEEPVAVADEDEDTMFFVRLPRKRTLFTTMHIGHRCALKPLLRPRSGTHQP